MSIYDHMDIHHTVAKVEGVGVLEGKFCRILEYRLCASPIPS